MKITKIFILSLGCPRNLVDSELIAGQLENFGYDVVNNIKDAKVVLINTCGFIQDAKEESIESILQAISLKKEGAIKYVFVMGCLSQRYKGKLANEIKEVDFFFGSDNLEKIAISIKEFLENKKTEYEISEPDYIYTSKTPRKSFTASHIHYLKIQEGCLNHCSFCIIPQIKGRFRSRYIEDIVREARDAVKRGVKEINIIGQDVTSYGIDNYRRRSLHTVVREISDEMKRCHKNIWIRILYTHPANFYNELIETIASSDNVCKYVDLPIQHINNKILKKMNRHIDRDRIIRLISDIRKNIKNVAIRTSVIVGFPQETDKDFQELLNFLKDTKFEKLGCFIYSREEDTKAYKFSGHIPLKIKQSRFKEVMKLQQDISGDINKKMLNKTLDVLIDKIENKDNNIANTYLGRTQWDAPEVDGNVFINAKSKTMKEGCFVKAKIIDTLEYDLVGELI